MRQKNLYLNLDRILKEHETFEEMYNKLFGQEPMWSIIIVTIGSR